MIRVALILLCAMVLGVATPSSAQKPAGSSAAPPAISADQARAALDVLNDPAKRAAFSATLNALIKAQTAGTAPAQAGSAPGDVTKPPAAETTVEGLTIPLAPDSLGAQVLLSASAF